MNLVYYIVGMFLLYCPPLLVWTYSTSIDSFLFKIPRYIIFSASVVLMVVMFQLMPTVPPFVFIFYMISFNSIYLLYNLCFKSKGEAFRVAIYVCFAISVLWEWPIQLTNYQNPIAVALSGFKALAIPFLFITVKNIGWRLSIKQAVWLNITVFYGLILTYYLTIKSPLELYNDLHFYRIYWLVWFILIIIETYINSREHKIRQ